MANPPTEERLREYENVVEALDEMIVVLDREYRYVLANQAFLDYRGMQREQVVGRTVTEVWGEDVFEDIKGRLDEAFHGNTVRSERKHNLPSSGERDLSLFYFPIKGPAGIDRVACIVEDVTELKQAERERETLFEALEASNEQLQVLSNRLAEVQEEERKRLARELHDQISRILAELMMQLGTTKELMPKVATSTTPGSQELSPREQEVLQLIIKGQTNKVIAEELSLSIRTVERYRSSIMKKLGLHNSAELIIYAITHGFLNEEE